MATESQKNRKKEAREINKCKLYDFCQVNNVELNPITDYQIRLNEKVDVFVTSKKLFDLQTKKWGIYENEEDLLKLIK